VQLGLRAAAASRLSAPARDAGVVAPVYNFYEDARGSEPEQAGGAWRGACEYAGRSDVRTLGNTFWVDASSGLQSFHFRCCSCVRACEHRVALPVSADRSCACRGDLLPVTDVGRKHLQSAKEWALNVTQPLPWDALDSWTHALYAPEFGTRLAVFSFLTVASDAASAPHDTARSELCDDILRLAGVHVRRRLLEGESAMLSGARR